MILMLLLVLPACTPTAADLLARNNGQPVALVLRRSGLTVWIEQGSDGPQYTVWTTDDRLLHQKVPERDLQARDPVLYNDIQQAIASSDRISPDKARRWEERSLRQ